jgi:hypothetical protein
MEYVMVGGMHLAADDVACLPAPQVAPLAISPVRATAAGDTPVSVRRVEAHTPPIPEVLGVVEHVSLPTSTPDIDEDADGAPLRLRSLADLLGAAPR